MSATARRFGAALLLTVLATFPVAAAGPGFHGRVLTTEAGHIHPIAAATVEFIGAAGSVAAKAETDGSGYYRTDLPAGIYSYVLHKDGFLPDAGRSVTLQLCDGYAVCDFTLIPGTAASPSPPPVVVPTAKLGGRVYEKNESGKLVGVSGAVISFRQTAGGAMTTVLSDRSGTGGYEIVLPAGAWRASVRANGFEFLLEPQPIDVSAETVTGHDFILLRSPAKNSR